MPRRNTNTRAGRYDPRPGRYTLDEVTDVTGIIRLRDDLVAHFAEQRRRIRRAHGS